MTVPFPLMKTDVHILQLKVSLLGSKPLIWRRLLVPSGATFATLSDIIQDSFGWYGGHLHQFWTKGAYGRDSRAIVNKNIEGFEEADETAADESKTRVNDLLSKVGDTVTYEYDFGDGWLHSVVLENIVEKETGTEYPRCVDGKNACPPEDCGGLGGYAHLLEVLKNPKHPEHQDMRDWLELEEGEKFDPTHFELE